MIERYILFAAACLLIGGFLLTEEYVQRYNFYICMPAGGPAVKNAPDYIAEAAPSFG